MMFLIPAREKTGKRVFRIMASAVDTLPLILSLSLGRKRELLRSAFGGAGWNTVFFL
jgi:hypothetical protein